MLNQGRMGMGARWPVRSGQADFVTGRTRGSPWADRYIYTPGGAPRPLGHAFRRITLAAGQGAFALEANPARRVLSITGTTPAATTYEVACWGGEELTALNWQYKSEQVLLVSPMRQVGEGVHKGRVYLFNPGDGPVDVAVVEGE